METAQLHQLFIKASGVSTDTRNIKPGSIFFALKGENFNGNTFAAQALENGAAYAVIDEKPAAGNENLILVGNSLETLQQLAAFHRQYLDLTILALTGSNGKTTTKELINKVLSRKYKTAATTGNLNNHIGVPLTLLSMNRETEIGIVEMGANHPKEIEFLCNIAQPDYGFITNFGKAHLEGFKSLEGVIKAKSELYDHLKTHEGMIFLNQDDPVQRKQLEYHKTFTFGEDKNSDIRVKYTHGTSFAQIEFDGLEVQSQLIGTYNAVNMAAAACIGKHFKVPSSEIKKALEEFSSQNNRSQVITKGTNKIILDAYNANPTSMEAALENLEKLQAASKIVILGDMFEIGSLAEEEHQHLVTRLENSNLNSILLIGKQFFQTSTSDPRIRKFKSFNDFKEDHDLSETKEATILIKGSRGMALERTLELI